jgi:hypothetical protein
LHCKKVNDSSLVRILVAIPERNKEMSIALCCCPKGKTSIGKLKINLYEEKKQSKKIIKKNLSATAFLLL